MKCESCKAEFDPADCHLCDACTEKDEGLHIEHIAERVRNEIAKRAEGLPVFKMCAMDVANNIRRLDPAELLEERDGR